MAGGGWGAQEGQSLVTLGIDGAHQFRFPCQFLGLVLLTFRLGNSLFQGLSYTS